MERLFMSAVIFLGLCQIPAGAQTAYTQQANTKNDTVYVSSRGSDIEGKGTLAYPFYSLDKAVGGGLLPGAASDTLFVLVAPGDYYMQKPFTLDESPSRPVVIKSQGSGKPRFIGGIRVDGWQKSEGGLYRAYIPQVLQYGFDFEQFYVNGKRAVLARTPNTDWLFVKSSKEQTIVKGERLPNYAVQQIDFHPSDWNSLSGLPMDHLDHLKFRFYHKWDITRKCPDYIETDSARIYMEGRGMKPWNPIQKGTRYFMYDYKEALDAPGEWYLDRKSGYIYYMPQQGEDMSTAFCIAPMLHQWVVMKGKPGKAVKNITFENLSFQYSSYLIPEKGEEPAQAAANTEAAMQFDFSENIVLQNCELLHTGAYGIWFGQECHQNKVSHCYIADLGAGGIKIGEPYFRASNRKVTSGNIMDNNIITSAGHEQPCGVGIAILHSSDNRVTHNEISDLLYSGVSVGWFWGYNSSSPTEVLCLNDEGREVSDKRESRSPAVNNKVMYNHIHHIGWGELSDMGAVYTLGQSPGTCVSHNVIHDVYSYDYGGWGLYTDEGSTGVEMSYNLVYRCKSGGFHQHYGKENRILNNILAFGYTNQLQCTRAEKHVSFTFRHNLVLVQDEVLFKGNWETANIDADYNLYWRLSGKPDFCGKDFKTWKKSKEHHSIMTNPQFKNPQAGDFTLKSPSVVRKVGFKPFDYSKAGVYGEESWMQKARLSPERQEEFSRIVEHLLSTQKQKK